MPVVVLCTETGVRQEVPSKSEGFKYPKPSTGNFQVVVTRTYPCKFGFSEV